MSWWSKKKRVWSATIGGLVLLVFVYVLVLRFMGPKIGNTFCTLAGCLGGLGITVEGLPDAIVYDISVQSIHGHEQTLTCEIGRDYSQDSPFVNGCVADGVSFTLDMDERPPDKIVVTVTANGKKISKVFYPTYEEYYPNGKDCLPVCYGAMIIMNVTQ